MSAQSTVRWSSRFSALLFTLALLAFSVGLPAGGAPPPSAPAANLDQWANDTNPPQPKWQNGNLNPSNSQYAEGDGVPYRLLVTDLGSDPTVTHTVNIGYDFTKGGVYKFDTLATYNLSDVPNISGNIPGGGYAWPGGSPSTFPFPPDPYFLTDTGPGNASYDPEAELILASASSRDLTIFGGTITAITPPVHSGLSTGDSSAQITVSFTSSGEDVALLWAGHLAKSAGWGSGRGAASGGGAPFHTRISNLDGQGGANQDRSIQLKFESSISTDASSGGTVGTTLHDTATVTSNSNPNPSGTVTFNLYGPSDPNCTGAPTYSETVALATGPGTASTATGFVSNAAGTWTWIATYNGDSKNSPSSGVCSDPDEKTTITASSGGTPSLELTKTADSASVTQGSTIGYLIQVTNTGNASATGVRITDTVLPSGTGVSWSVDTGANTTASNCSISGTAPNQSLACGTDTLAAGASLKVHITSPTTNDSCKTYDNAGATTADDANHSATQVGTASISVTGCIAAAAALELTKTADAASVTQGSTIGYMIRVTNTGNAPANAVSISDSALPSGTGVSWSVDTASTTASNCAVTTNGSNQSLACTGSTLAPGTSVQVHITSATTNESCGTYNNAGATASDNANHTATQQGTASITVINCVLAEVFTAKETKVLGEQLARTGTPLHLNELALLALVLIMCGYTLSRVSRKRSTVLASYVPKHSMPGRKLSVPRKGRRSEGLLFKR